VLAILYFVCGTWFSGILDLMLGLIGWCALREELNYNVQQLMCYVVFSIMRVIYNLIDLISFGVGVSSDVNSAAAYQWVYGCTLVIGAVFYVRDYYLEKIGSK
jgi:hypothetical protein